MEFPQIRCIGKAFRPLDVPRVPELSLRVNIPVPAVGGGSSPPRSAGCTRAKHFAGPWLCNHATFGMGGGCSLARLALDKSCGARSSALGKELHHVTT